MPIVAVSIFTVNVQLISLYSIRTKHAQDNDITCTVYIHVVIYRGLTIENISDVNKDLTFKAKDKDQTFKAKDND